jgi:hypothetical protein
MRYLLRPHTRPTIYRLLLVESGSRALLENLIPVLGEIEIDLVTCYGGIPKGVNGKVYRVMDYATPESRKALYRELAANQYQAAGIICSGEPIMTKWKWMLAARIPAPVFMLNENGDYVWIDRTNVATLWEFVRIRTGLTGAGAVRTVALLLLFPFSLMYLLLYATAVHARRALRQLTQ